ncbi:hypothetical protein PoB_005642400 [Plakobranchus ocellatus]|uniref:Uncharacterized protein n=1 Tax=Plakobranchus ocellatus TaxID=259542 RepID=A0AAV4CFI2_9GAST|nr:hypothetical protein PoB_005642400 [Plakobranchus ocellatus]
MRKHRVIHISIVEQKKTRGYGQNVTGVINTDRWRLLPDQEQRDLRLSGPPSGQGVGGGARTHDRRVLANLRADSLSNVPSNAPVE